MKQDLVRHIEEVFYSLRITVPFEVYDCNNDILPEWANSIQLTNEFFLCCSDLSVQKRLQVFTGRDIHVQGKYVYWFEGERISAIDDQPDEIELIVGIKHESVEYLKTETRLPAFLDDYIFNELNAVYEPDFQKFEFNLDLNKDEVLRYLGTYFPRSYAESFCIFDNIFQNNDYSKTITKNESLDILSVGCGTGGDLIGLLTIIEKYCHHVSVINIWAIDGNREALDILKQIVQKFSYRTNIKINLNVVAVVFSSISNVNIEAIKGISFDYILSFKFVCELIAKGNGSLDNSYYEFAKQFLPLLSDNGLCVLLDVTTKARHTTYNPILMNSQVNQAIRDLSDYKILIPKSCGKYGSVCHFDCFHQQTFYITHQRWVKDKSKVAYKILGRSDYVNNMKKEENNSKLTVNNGEACMHTMCFPNIEDAFLLK